MDALWGFFGGVFKLLAFELVFFWPGWLVLKVVTLGQYPKLTKHGRCAIDYEDVQLVSYVGLSAVLAALILVVKYWP